MYLSLNYVFFISNFPWFFKLTIIRCEESNPSEHTLSNLSTFYKLPDDILNRMYTKDTFSRQYKRHSEAFGEHTMMIRRNMLEVTNYLKNADYSLPVNKYLFENIYYLFKLNKKIF